MNIYFALLVTLLLETLVYIWLKPKSLKLLYLVLVLNIILNPLMNILLTSAPKVEVYNLILLSFELGTITVEALILYFVLKTPLKRTFLFALSANVLSFIVGFSFNLIAFERNIFLILNIALTLSYLIVLGGLTFLFTRKEKEKII